ncbi:MAG: alcohol dehydrogenase catalytic domain-containing protein [Granulosicoccus sp.]
MKALNYPARGEILLGDMIDPVAAAGQVLIDVKASGICGTDIEVLHGNYGTSAFPVVPGHEFSGIVVDIGDGVKSVRTGDRVVIDPNLACGDCDACGRGRSNLCVNLGAYGVTVNGGFADFCSVNAEAVHGIGTLDFETAALAEPLACVLNGIHAIDATTARHALIFGAGPIGLIMATTLQVQGVESIQIVDIDPLRVELAESLGFNGIVSAPDTLKGFHQSVDLVIDCTGVAAVAQELVSFAIDGGKVLFFGVCPADAEIHIHPHELFRRQLTLAGSHSLIRNIPDALAILQADPAKFRALISDCLPLDEIPAFLDGSRKSTLKVQAVRQ